VQGKVQIHQITNKKVDKEVGRPIEDKGVEKLC